MPITKGDVYTIKGRHPDVDTDYNLVVMVLEDIIPGRVDVIPCIILSSHMDPELREYEVGNTIKFGIGVWLGDHEADNFQVEPRTLTFRIPTSSNQ